MNVPSACLTVTKYLVIGAKLLAGDVQLIFTATFSIETVTGAGTSGIPEATTVNTSEFKPHPWMLCAWTLN